MDVDGDKKQRGLLIIHLDDSCFDAAGAEERTGGRGVDSLENSFSARPKGKEIA